MGKGLSNMNTPSPYVRLLVTLKTGRSIALPPLLVDEARRMHTELRKNGHKETDRNGAVIHTPPTDFVVVDYIPYDAPASEKKVA
jgi:hypothetical protein